MANATREQLEELGVLDHFEEHGWFEIYSNGGCGVWEKAHGFGLPDLAIVLQRVDQNHMGNPATSNRERPKREAARACAEWHSAASPVRKHVQAGDQIGKAAERFKPAIKSALRSASLDGATIVDVSPPSVQMIEAGQRRCVLVTAVLELAPPEE